LGKKGVIDLSYVWPGTSEPRTKSLRTTLAPVMEIFDLIWF
jgi:hypothetical protein